MTGDLSDRLIVGASDRHGEAATTLRVVHRGSLAPTVIQNALRRPDREARTAFKWLGAPCQGPGPVDHKQGGDVMQGTRSGAPTCVRHPAEESTEVSRVSLRRGAVVVCAADPGSPLVGGVP